MSLGSLIDPGRSLGPAIERVRRAEALGYGSAYVSHVAGRDSLTVLAAYASATERIKLGTAVLPIYSRSPVATAQAAATLDELSGGRMLLGLGVSHEATVESWYGQRIGDPVKEMGEYAGAVRAILRGEEPPAVEGGRFPTRFRFRRYDPRPRLPVYLAALAPEMLRLAGATADGVMLWLCSPDYVREVVIPMVSEGRARAGLPLEGFEIVAAVPSAVTDDPAAARARLRGYLGTYLGLPSFRGLIERSGHAHVVNDFDAAMRAGGAEAAAAAIGDEFLGTLSAIGSAEEAGASLQRYLDAGVTTPLVGSVPGTDFDVTLEALAPLASGA